MIHEFRSSTSLDALRPFTCASCAERVRGTKWSDVPLIDINLELLRPPLQTTPNVGCIAPPMAFADNPLEGVLVERGGVFCDDAHGMYLALCPPCKSALSRNRLPRFSLANLNVVGPVPAELKDLTLVEEIIVARCRAKLCIIKLQDHRDDVELPTGVIKRHWCAGLVRASCSRGTARPGLCRWSALTLYYMEKKSRERSWRMGDERLRRYAPMDKPQETHCVHGDAKGGYPIWSRK